MITEIRIKNASGLSGFFAPHITNNLETTGAIGGGLGIDKAISARIFLDLNYEGIDVVNYVNGSKIESCLAKYIVEKILSFTKLNKGRIIIEQNIFVPIGGGYGTSGGSAVAISFAIAKALKLSLDFYSIAKIAHEADIICRTGLGTVVGIIKPCNGITIVAKPGGPGYAEVMCIPIDNSLTALTAFYKPVSKSFILSNLTNLKKIEVIGIKTLNNILQNPTPENFIENCYNFTIETNLLTPTVKHAIDLLKKIDGVVGVSMNMIGEAIFALIDKNVVDKTVEILRKTNPSWIYVWKPGCNGIDIESVEVKKNT